MTLPVTPGATPTYSTRALNLNQNASSLGPMSGVDGSGYYCSTMYVQEQNLDYHYKRVPLGSLSWAPSDVSLTSVRLGGTVEHTVMICEVVATTRAYVVSGECWETARYTQLQKFEIDAASALDGLSYGTISPGTMGPAGRVFNAASATYYHREPYDACGQPLWATQVRIGYNWAVQSASANALCAATDFPNAVVGKWWGTDKHFSLATQLPQDADELCGKKLPIMDAWLNHKQGAYATSQDSIFDVQLTTDQVGWAVQEGSWVNWLNNTLLPCNYDPGLHYWGP